MNFLPISSDCNSDYTEISDVLGSKPEYFSVCVNNFAPSDRYMRRHWLDKLTFPFRAMIMKYPYGNRLGTLSFVWKVPEEADETKNARVMLQVTQEIKKYSTREMRRDLLKNISVLLLLQKAFFAVYIIISRTIPPVPQQWHRK